MESSCFRLRRKPTTYLCAGATAQRRSGLVVLFLVLPTEEQSKPLFSQPPRRLRQNHPEEKQQAEGKNRAHRRQKAVRVFVQTVGKISGRNNGCAEQEAAQPVAKHKAPNEREWAKQ